MKVRPSVVVASLAAMLAVSGPADAHTPTPADAGQTQYAEATTFRYTWGWESMQSGTGASDPQATNVPPAWLQSGLSADAGSALSSSYANPPVLVEEGGTTGVRGEIYYFTTAEGPCGATEIACAWNDIESNDTLQQTHRNPKPTWRLTVTKQNTSCGSNCCGSGCSLANWCESPARRADDPCHHIRRVLIHEIGHLYDLGHSTQGQDYTVMQSATPTGNSDTSFDSCDRARLQLKYSRDTTSRTPSTCLHEINDVSDGKLRTDVSLNVSDTFVCSGEGVTFSGHLNIRDLTAYGHLGGDAIGSRDVILQYRAWGSTGSFTDYVTDSTNSSGNWSRNLGFSGSVDREWRARFGSGNDMLYQDNSAGVRVRWSTAC